MKITKNKATLPPSLEEYVINMSENDADELRVLVYVLSKDGELDTSEMGEILGLSETDVIAAVSYWRGAGLISVSGKSGRGVGNKAKSAKKSEQEAQKSASELPEKKETKAVSASARDVDTRTYTGEEIAKALEAKPELNSLVDFAQRRLERTSLSSTDIGKLVYLEDYVLLTAPMIMRIIDYCVENGKKSMRYVEKTAISIYDEGITTYEALEAYFEKKKAAKSAEGIVRRIVGAGDRSFTSKEKVLIAKWFEEYGSGEELISLAYEKTIANISKPSLPYMSKLLELWHGKGFKTVSEVENARNAQESTSGSVGIDLAAFDEASRDGGASQTAAELNLEDFFENPV